MSNHLGTWQAARTPSKVSPDLGCLTHLACHRAQLKVKYSALHSQIQRQVTSALLAQGQPAAPSSPPATSHCHLHTQTSSAATTPRRIRSSKQNNHIFQGYFKTSVTSSNWDPRHLLGRSKGVKGDTRYTSMWELWKCQGGAFQSSFCHPRIVSTSQRNTRLLKLGRTTYPYSSIKWLLVAPCDTSSICHSKAVLGHSSGFGGTFQGKDYQLYLMPLTKPSLQGFPWSCEQHRTTITLTAACLPEERTCFPTGTKNKNNFQWGTQWTSCLFFLKWEQWSTYNV